MIDLRISIDYDQADALLVQILRSSVKTHVENPVQSDEEYERRYIEAANLVIAHFGGEPVTKEAA